MMKKLIVSLISCLMFSSFAVGATTTIQSVSVRSIASTAGSGVTFGVTTTGAPIPVTLRGGEAVTSTVYIIDVTTSITGAAWIDCRGFKKVTFEIVYRGDRDSAAVVGVSVTSFIDASNEVASSLPTTSVYPLWNNQIGGSGYSIISNVSNFYSVYDVPSSLRWRLSGVFGATVCVRYKLEP